MEFSEELIRGSIVPVVLTMLNQQDMYGYEIVKTVNARTNGALQWKEGTLYPALHRLESRKLIRSYWKQAESTGKDRKYYALTRRGRTEMARQTQEWQQFSTVLNSLLLLGDGRARQTT